MRPPDGAPGPPPGAPEAPRFPWPPAPEGSAAEALADTWRGSVFAPTAFFRALPAAPRLGPALLYYLIVGIAAAAVGLFWSLVFRAVGGAEGGASPLAAALGASTDTAWPLVNFLLSPFWLLLMLGVSVAAVHAVLWVVGGARRGARTTVAVLCYAYGPAIFSIVPVLGDLVGFVWVLVLAIVGVREAHGTDGWRAAVAVLLPLLLAFALVVVAGMIAALGATRLA